MVNLTILVYFVPYLYLFAAYLRLRTEATKAATAWAAAGCGFLATFISIALVFVPPTGTENVLNYEANVVGQSVLLLIVGLGLYWISARRLGAGAGRRSPS
jgi:hypothetical protein